jgi:hypothetical protein
MSKVHVLHYHHKHGDDITVYKSYQAALVSACDIIVQFIYDDLEDETVEREKIVSLIEAGNYVKAISEWNSTMEDRYCNDYISILGPQVAFGSADLNKDLKRHLKEYREQEVTNDDDS